MEITTFFNQLSFHDSIIESVSRCGNTIEITFGSVVVAPEHPQTNGNVIEIRNAKLNLFGVTAEKALIWYDSKAPLHHPNPSFPVNEVMHGTLKETGFHFDGFWQTDNWSEWFIVAKSFVLVGEAVSCSRLYF